MNTLTTEALGELELRVQSRVSGRVRDLRVSAYGDGLVLEGFSHTYYAKQLAQEAVMEATHMPIVANDIKVA